MLRPPPRSIHFVCFGAGGICWSGCPQPPQFEEPRAENHPHVRQRHHFPGMMAQKLNPSGGPLTLGKPRLTQRTTATPGADTCDARRRCRPYQATILSNDLDPVYLEPIDLEPKWNIIRTQPLVDRSNTIACEPVEVTTASGGHMRAL